MRIRVDWLFLLVELAACIVVVGMLLLAPTHHCVSFDARHGLRMMERCPERNTTGILEAPLEDVFIERTTNEGKQERGFLTSKMSVPRATVCNQIQLADINIYPCGKFLMGWVVYLLVQNVGFCCLRITGEQMFRRRIGNAAVSIVTVACLSLAIYMSLLDHDRLHSTAWSSFRSVVGGSSVGSSFDSTLPWNWNWAKIISVCLFLWKIVHFIINHMHNDLTVGTSLPEENIFDTEAVGTRRMHAGACVDVPVSLATFLDLPEHNPALKAINTRLRKIAGKMLNIELFNSPEQDAAQIVFMKWMDTTKPPWIGDETAPNGSLPADDATMARLKAALEDTTVLKTLVKDDENLHYWGRRGVWIPAVQEFPLNTDIIKLATDIRHIAELGNPMLNSDILIAVAVIWTATLAGGRAITHGTATERMLRLILTSNPSIAEGKRKAVMKALSQCLTGADLGVLIRGISHRTITHTAVTSHPDSDIGQDADDSDEEQEPPVRQLKERPNPANKKHPIAQTICGATQGSFNSAMPPGVPEGEPIHPDREKRLTDVVRMIEAAKKTQVGEKLREIAVASYPENTQDDYLLKKRYLAVGVQVTFHKGVDAIRHLRELDGLYIIKCSSEYIDDYTVDWLLQMAIGSLIVGGFCVVNEDLAELHGETTRDELTKQFVEYRHTVDGRCYGFEMQDPELVMYPSEFFWVLVKKEIPASQ